jgi:glycosyl transferase family 87
VGKRGIALAWGTLLGAVLLWQTAMRASRPDGIDLTSYLLSARALAHGASPYLLATPFPYLYPATLAFLLIPLAMAPSIVALVAWFALNAFAALWSVRRVALSVRPDLEQRPETVAVLLAVFFTVFLPIVQSNLRNGQVNFIVLALCVAAALPRQNDHPAHPAPPAAPAHPAHPAHPARPARSAFLWSSAIAIKIVPLVLLPYFAFRRRWPWILQAAVYCVVLLLAPAIVAGARITDIYREYTGVLLASSFATRGDPLDFSLGGTIAAVSATPATPALRISAAAVVVGWILQADGRRLRHEHARPLTLYLLGIPLASPKSEIHHLAFLLPAAVMIAAEWWWPPNRRNRLFTMAAVAAAALYLAATIIPLARGPLYCAMMIAAGVALMKRP